MLKSMTGYGKSSSQADDLSIELEVKSVNSRYLDINIKMPNSLNFLEDSIRKFIKDRVSRGRLDIFIRSKKRNISKSRIEVDTDIALDMKKQLEKIVEITGLDSRIELKDILKNEEVLNYVQDELDQDYVRDQVISVLEIALDQFEEMRQIEGENLKAVLKDFISNMSEITEQIKYLSKDFTKEYKEKLEESINKMLDGKNPIDEDRLANEIVFMADRADINEEISRLESHYSQFISNLEVNQPVGKKLDFICQEMLRETNTIGSKSSKIEITDLVIEQKTIIEKVKEQVQNIE